MVKKTREKKKKTENGHSEIDSNELQTKFKASYLSFTSPSSLEDVFTVKHGVNSIDSRLPAVLFATSISHSGVDNTKIEWTVASPTDSNLQHRLTKPRGDKQSEHAPGLPPHHHQG